MTKMKFTEDQIMDAIAELNPTFLDDDLAEAWGNGDLAEEAINYLKEQNE